MPHTTSSTFGTTWAVVAKIDFDEAEAPVMALLMMFLIVGALVAVAAAVIGLLVARSIAKPLSDMTSAMGELANKVWST